MPYTEWPYVEAQRIIERLQKLGRATVTTETGYGPSGLPHLGTFGEVARTSFVLQALKTLAPQVESKLIAFSDDMDGLREVPQNVPNREMLKPHLGKPLTSVPDPFGQEPSYAHFMNKRLREFLDSFGFRYDFASSTEQYRSGRFNDAIRRVMEHYDEIREMFVATIAEEKRATWSPFFPVCGSCGRIYSTRVTAIDREGLVVSYACDTPLAGKYECCGHTGNASVLDGGCKLGWKVDWALRWFALGIDYETHGEDLLDSVRLSSTHREGYRRRAARDVQVRAVPRREGQEDIQEARQRRVHRAVAEVRARGLAAVPDVRQAAAGEEDGPAAAARDRRPVPRAGVDVGRGHGLARAVRLAPVLGSPRRDRAGVRALLDDRGPRHVPGHRGPRAAARIPREVPARRGGEHRVPRPARSRMP